MDSLEKRRYDREKKRLERIEADLEPERIMRAAMELERKMLQTNVAPADASKTTVMFERMRGIVLNEEDNTQDYELIVTQDEITLRGLKNTKSRVADEDRVILVYGRNLNEAGIAILKDLLKLCRTQPSRRKVLKRPEDLTPAEEAAIQDEFFNQYLPTGWYFDG